MSQQKTPYLSVLFIFISFFSFATHANIWQQLNQLIKPKSVDANPLTANEKAFYPQHYQLHRVLEPTQQSPLFFLQTGKSNKPSILLVHGLGQLASKDWLNVIPALEQDYNVYALDLPGFGLSQGKYFEYSPHNYSEIIHWFIDNIIKQKTIVVGHSMGAAVSLYFAASYPQQVEKLVLINAAGILNRTSFLKHLAKFGVTPRQFPKPLQRLLSSGDSWSDGIIENIDNWYDPTKHIQQNPLLRKLALGKTANVNAALALVSTDFSKLDWQHITDTQLIWGKQDPIAPPRTGEALSSLIPNAQLHLIYQAGHVPMKSQIQQFNQLLLQTIKQPINKPEQLSSNRNQGHGQCRDDDNPLFTGHYQSISIDNCKLVELNQVTTQSLSIKNAIVDIKFSHIGNSTTPISIDSSRVTATSSSFNNIIHANESRLDFAAVKLTSPTQAIHAKQMTHAQLSLCKVDNQNFAGSVHGSFSFEQAYLIERLDTEQQLIK